MHCRPKRGLREMTVATSKIDETLLISIDRPPVNALDLDAIAELKQAFATAAREMPQGGVVLTGGGDVFSAGVDTRAFASYSGEQRHAMVQAITHMVAQLLAIAVPVVAAVNGHALGGGFVLMLGCDYRMGVDREAARLGMTMMLVTMVDHPTSQPACGPMARVTQGKVVPQSGSERLR